MIESKIKSRDLEIVKSKYYITKKLLHIRLARLGVLKGMKLEMVRRSSHSSK